MRWSSSSPCVRQTEHARISRGAEAPLHRIEVVVTVRHEWGRSPIVENVVMNIGAKVLNARFAWRGEAGTVRAECVPNTDPDFYGCWWWVAEGFPVCTATVDYPALGYRSMLGWVQVVRSTDNESGGLTDSSWTHSGFSATHLRLTAGTGSARPSSTLRHVRSGNPLSGWRTAFWQPTPLDEVAQLKARRVVPACGVLLGLHRHWAPA